MLHPRPVVLVGAGDLNGEYSFAPASWVTPVSDEPPVVAVALSEESYTRELLLERGEFTLCVLSVDQVDEILYLGSVSGREVDKLSVVGWRAVRAREVDAPALDNALGVLECRVRQTLQVDEMTLVLADVVGAGAVEGAFSDRYGWDLRRVKIPLHAAGRTFVEPGRLVLADAERFRARRG